MDAAKAAKIKAHAQALAELLYAETEADSPEQLETFEGIESAIRDHFIAHIGPELGHFFAEQQAATQPGAAVRLRTSSATSASQAAKRKR